MCSFHDIQLFIQCILFPFGAKFNFHNFEAIIPFCNKVAHQSFPHLSICSHVNATSKHNQSQNGNHIKICKFSIWQFDLIDFVSIDSVCSALSLCLKTVYKGKMPFVANLKSIFMPIPFDGNV